LQETYDAHGEAVRTKLRKLGVSGPDLNEMVQTVFSVAQRRRKEMPRDKNGARRWLLDVARKHAANWHRLYRHYYETLDAPEIIENALARPEDPEREFAIIDVVQKTMSRLSPEDQEVLILHDIDGASLRQIAEMLNLTKSGVHVRLTRARERFLEVYERLQRQHRFYLPLLAALAGLLRRVLGAGAPTGTFGNDEATSSSRPMPVWVSLYALALAILSGPLAVLWFVAVSPAPAHTGLAALAKSDPPPVSPSAPATPDPTVDESPAMTARPPIFRSSTPDQGEVDEEEDPFEVAPSASAPPEPPLSRERRLSYQQISQRIADIRNLLREGSYDRAVRTFTLLLVQFPDAPRYEELSRLHRMMLNLKPWEFNEATVNHYLDALAELDPLRLEKTPSKGAAP
jgi:RNA polymerase sigma-70 factor (ECF subfamily)